MAPTTSGISPAPAASSRQRLTLALVSTATFMLLLDITVVSVALPPMQRELHASLSDLQWVIDAYTLVLAVSLYVQNTLGYSPLAGGLRFLPLSLVGFAVAPVTGRVIGRIPMRALLGAAMITAAAGLAVMARLHAGSAWTVLLPGFVLAGVGLGVTSTAISSAALSEVEPDRAGMAVGIVNTLRQVGTATGVAVLGALFAARVTASTLHALAALPIALPRGSARLLVAAVGSGAGTRVASGLPNGTRAAISHAAQAGTASGLNEVLLTAAGIAALGAVAAFALTRQPRPHQSVPTAEPPAEPPAIGVPTCSQT
jgi:MFS family permease